MKNNCNSSYYKINGGKKLSGTIITNGAKNSAMGLLCASLLNEGTTTFHNMPEIEEVFRMIEIMNSIGVQTKWLSNNILKITPPKKYILEKINVNSAQKTRSVIMFIGSLMHKIHNFNIPFSGGCKLGKRTVKPHIYALENLGINISTKENYYQIKKTNRKTNQEIILFESGDTTTENVIMASSLIPQKTTIRYASCNYQVQDLCNFLKNLGVKIDNITSTNITIHGVKKINKNIIYHVSEDPIESMLFISIAATTNSQILIKKCPIRFLELELYKLEKMGFKYKITKKYLSKNNFTELCDIQTLPSQLISSEEKIDARPYPGINIDNLPFFVPIATQAKGETLIHDWVYENRAIYYVELIRLGGNIILADPHRVYIKGPVALKGSEIVSPPALRPSAIILVGMLAAKGQSILRNIYGIERGYENLVDRLKSIGAQIEKIKV
jgi:UDP-N-acetylglucosamine 1-carboxyvinyltransferase